MRVNIKSWVFVPKPYREARRCGGLGINFDDQGFLDP